METFHFGVLVHCITGISDSFLNSFTGRAGRGLTSLPADKFPISEVFELGIASTHCTWSVWQENNNHHENTNAGVTVSCEKCVPLLRFFRN